MLKKHTNSFSVTLPLKEPTQRVGIIHKPNKNLPNTLTDRQEEILKILKLGKKHVQEIIKKMRGDSTLRTIQRDLMKLKDLDLISSKKSGKFVMWMLKQK